MKGCISLLKVCTFILCIVSVAGVRIMFENFEQLSGFDETLFELRVRKYNRTMSVLNGSIIIPHPINDTTEVGFGDGLMDGLCYRFAKPHHSRCSSRWISFTVD